MEISSLFVCLMGMGVTFIGLTALIFLIQIMGKLLNPAKKADETTAPPAVAETEDRGALIAAISAVLAEEMGTDVSGLRILELKRVS